MFFIVYLCVRTQMHLKKGWRVKILGLVGSAGNGRAVLSFWWLHCTYWDTRHHVCTLCSFKSPLPIFFTPSRLALCGSMCLGKTAFRTNWSQWQKLQGCMSRLHLHGNTAVRVSMSSLQHSDGITASDMSRLWNHQERGVDVIDGGSLPVTVVRITDPGLASF